MFTYPQGSQPGLIFHVQPLFCICWAPFNSHIATLLVLLLSYTVYEP